MGRYHTIICSIVIFAVGNRWEPEWDRKWRNVHCTGPTRSYQCLVIDNVPRTPFVALVSALTAQCECSVGQIRYFPDTDTHSDDNSKSVTIWLEQTIEINIPSLSWSIQRLVTNNPCVIPFHTQNSFLHTNGWGRVRGAITHGGPRQNGRRFADDGWKFIFVCLDSTFTKICSQGAN